MTDERRLVSREELAAALHWAGVDCLDEITWERCEPANHTLTAKEVFAALPQPATQPSAEVERLRAIDDIVRRMERNELSGRNAMLRLSAALAGSDHEGSPE